MPGAHTHLQYNLAYKFYTKPWPRIMDSAGKRSQSQKPAHGPPLQARVVAANRTVLTTCDDDPGTHGHGQVGAKQNERGQTDVEGSGHGMAKASRHTKPAEQGRCRRTQPADNPTGTGLEETTATDVGRPLAVQCRLVEGVRWCWPLRRRAQTY